jgi:UDP-4-amino-4,6-dideoxy-N-acetyl-beta-L-altrosamine N-acetyltransferase
MMVRGLGVELVRLQQEHIEMVRTWRNDERISRFMDFRQHITPQQQQLWFEGLSPEADFYFLIREKGEFHGLIHCSQIDWERNVGQSGLFISSAQFQGTHLPVAASCLMLEYFFTHTSLLAIEAKVMCANEVALNYNLGLGFQHIPSEAPDRYHRLRLAKADFYTAFGDNLNLLRKIHGSRLEVIA